MKLSVNAGLDYDKGRSNESRAYTHGKTADSVQYQMAFAPTAPRTPLGPRGRLRDLGQPFCSFGRAIRHC